MIEMAMIIRHALVDGKQKRTRHAVFFGACLPWFIAGAAWANVSVSKTFSDHMVLQRDQPLPIWGKAAAGEKVSVTLGSQSQSATTAANGQWMDPATLMANPSITNADKGGMWDTWVTPVVGYGIKGTVWIQGEQNCNATDAPLYGDRFPLLIKGWRKAWGQGDLPFYFGQLSSTSGTPAPDELSHVAQVRVGQRMGLRQPKTAMTVNFDIGAGDWHYPNKPEAGRRLSLAARALSYGEKNLPYSGPMLISKTIMGNQVKLRFAHAEGGLVAKSGKLAGFAIASAAGNWTWGDAEIRGDSVIVSHPSIPNPTKVRYAWSDPEWPDR